MAIHTDKEYDALLQENNSLFYANQDLRGQINKLCQALAKICSDAEDSLD